MMLFKDALPPNQPGLFLPESLRFNFDGSCLSWVDIETGTLSKLSLHTGAVSARFVANDLSFAHPLTGDDYLVAFGSVLAVLTSDGIQDVSGPLIADHRRFNDGSVDSRGRLVLGAKSREGTGSDNPLILCSEEKVEVLDNDLGLSNGIAIEPNTLALYSVDSQASTIYRRKLCADGRYAEPEIFYIFSPRETPDGIAFNDQGDLCVALWGSAAVALLNPKGVEVERWLVPSPFVTSVTLHPVSGDLYVGTASENREGLRNARRPGRIWRAPLGMSGTPNYDWVAFELANLGRESDID